MKTSLVSRLFALYLILPLTDAILFAKDGSEPELRVMSFNIRLGVANDGDNRWEFRKELVVQTIREFNPDLLGLQEVWPMQEKYLQENFPEYVYYGRSRLVDPEEGEGCAVMFKQKRFELIEKSTFWLSETPDEPASILD
jgi:endonuclease/exonuclease/phosphatase family metal-dependent hydrolase